MSHQSRTAYSLLGDPMYYGAVIFFAALTTALPALLGAPWFLVLAQTVTLWLLLLVPLRRNAARPAVIVLATWLAVQIATVFVLSLAAPNRLELAVGNGFRYREEMLLWLYAGAPLPASWFTQPLLHLLEIAGVTLGALVSGGLVGVGFLMRTVNLYAFGAAALVDSAGAMAGVMAALQPWLLLRIAGYAGILPLFALVGFTGEWLPGRWSPRRRKLLKISTMLLLAGLALELFLPALWATWFGSLVLAR